MYGIFTYIGIIWKITLGVNVGKYSSTMDPLGMLFYIFLHPEGLAVSPFHGSIYGSGSLGGELPTARFYGLVHPSDLHGIFVGLIHL